MANVPNDERVIGVINPMKGKPSFWYYDEKGSMQPVLLTEKALKEAQKIVEEDQDKSYYAIKPKEETK